MLLEGLQPFYDRQRRHNVVAIAEVAVGGHCSEFRWKVRVIAWDISPDMARGYVGSIVGYIAWQIHTEFRRTGSCGVVRREVREGGSDERSRMINIVGVDGWGRIDRWLFRVRRTRSFAKIRIHVFILGHIFISVVVDVVHHSGGHFVHSIVVVIEMEACMAISIGGNVLPVPVEG